MSLTLSEDQRTAFNDAVFTMDTAFPGWAEKIDTATLDLGSMSNCLLGQMFGNYTNGMAGLYEERRTNGIWTVRYGHVLWSDPFDNNVYLNDWLRVIAERREAEEALPTVTLNDLKALKRGETTLDALIDRLDPPKIVTVTILQKDAEWYVSEYAHRKAMQEDVPLKRIYDAMNDAKEIN